jgi:hypothetical protein
MSYGVPHREYSLPDYTLQLVREDQQQLVLCGEQQNRAGLGVVEGLTYGPKYENKQAAGSGTFPRAHGSPIGKPYLTITVDQDTAQLIDVFRGGVNGVVDVFISRAHPGQVPIVDALRKWLPLPDEADIKAGGETTGVKLNGMCVGPDAFKADYNGVIQYA